jgi:hypothetical protein
MPPPIAANANPSLGLVGGTDRGVLSLLAAIVLDEPPPLPPRTLLEALCEVAGRLYRELVDPEPLMVLERDCVWAWPREGDIRWLGGGVSMLALEREKGTTPARRAMSASPSCQCIASAARQGTAISSATLDHISGLNLWTKSVLFL